MSEPDNAPVQTFSQKMRALMAGKFPKAFFMEDEAIKPLKVGITEDILESLKEEITDELKIEQINIFLSWYTGRKVYRRAVIQNVMRINLEGEEVEAVTAEQKEHAHNKLEEEKKRVKEVRQHKTERRAKKRAKEEKRKAKEQKHNTQKDDSKIEEPKPVVPVSSIEVKHVKANPILQDSITSANSLKPKLTLKKKT